MCISVGPAGRVELPFQISGFLATRGPMGKVAPSPRRLLAGAEQ